MIENFVAAQLLRFGYRVRSLATNERQFIGAATAIEQLVATTPETILRGRRSVPPLPGITPAMQGWSTFMTIDHCNGVPFVPRAPTKAVEGQVIGLYGDGLSAGQNQVVSLNRGLRDGLEKGHVLALWRAGRAVVDRTDPARATLQLPDEKRGQLFVFRVFDRVSYALILDTLEPVSSGDRFSQP